MNIELAGTVHAWANGLPLCGLQAVGVTYPTAKPVDCEECNALANEPWMA